MRPQRKAAGTGRAGLLVGGLACLLALTVICLLFVRTRAGQMLDQQLLPAVGNDGVLSGPAQDLLSVAGDPLVLIAVCAAVFVSGALSGRIRGALAGVIVVGCSVAGARVLKLLVIRPDLGVSGSTTHNSFPSGHVAAATAVVCAVLLILPGPARPWAAVPGAVLVAAVGAATMILGWHRLSDVTGAVLLATALGLLAAWSVGGRRRRM